MTGAWFERPDGSVYGIRRAVLAILAGEGFEVRDVVLEETGIASARLRVLMPWWSWPWSLFGAKKKIAVQAKIAVDLVRPVGVDVDVSVGWFRRRRRR